MTTPPPPPPARAELGSRARARARGANALGGETGLCPRSLRARTSLVKARVMSGRLGRAGGVARGCAPTGRCSLGASRTSCSGQSSRCSRGTPLLSRQRLFTSTWARHAARRRRRRLGGPRPAEQQRGQPARRRRARARGIPYPRKGLGEHGRSAAPRGAPRGRAARALGSRTATQSGAGPQGAARPHQQPPASHGRRGSPASRQDPSRRSSPGAPPKRGHDLHRHPVGLKVHP